MKKFITILGIILISLAFDLNAKDKSEDIHFFDGEWIAQITVMQDGTDISLVDSKRLIKIFVKDSTMILQISEGGNSEIDTIVYSITEFNNNLNRIEIYGEYFSNKKDDCYSQYIHISYNRDNKPYEFYICYTPCKEIDGELKYDRNRDIGSFGRLTKKIK